MRGYGGTDAPDGVDSYSIFHPVGDMVALVQALGETRAVVVGHDWGAPVAWHCALTRSDLFRAVACLSIPFTPRRAGRPPIPTFQAIAKAMGKEFYILRFQPPGVEAAFDADPDRFLRTVFRAYDGATPDAERSSGFFEPEAPIMDALGRLGDLPPWMDEAELKVYTDAFAAKGFTGPVHWYRNLDRTWEVGGFLQGKRIDVPGWFMVGEKDPVRGYSGSGEAELEQWVPDLRGKHVVPGAGHWIQQERPDVVSQGLIGFLKGL
jgi:pimeloyl-ACP methyl ester carboxylesterase